MHIEYHKITHDNDNKKEPLKEKPKMYNGLPFLYIVGAVFAVALALGIFA